jgi:tRNA A-37 threonylcarbamoyl transferase component Bud32
MQRLSKEQYERLRAEAQVLEKDGHGDKVLRLADGTFLKLFRRKSWLSKTTFYPPAKRFAANAQALTKRGIPCPRIIQLYRLGDPPRSIVHYEPLAGTTLRDLVHQNDESELHDLFQELAKFVTQLHEKGVYFRSLHLGNIVLTPENSFGLIDISDMRCLDRPLSQYMRRRNYKHLLRYANDWANVPEDIRKLFSPSSHP